MINGTVARNFGWLIIPLVLVAAGAAWVLIDPGFRRPAVSVDAVSEVPQDAFEQRVRTYILEHPEVLVEAIRGLQSRQRAADESEATVALSARADEVFRDPTSPVMGNLAGDVSLVEFFDYNCPYCRHVAPVIDEAAAADPKLRIIYKEFPILGPGSLYAAKAALAAHRQGQYARFHQALISMEGAADPASVLSIAVRIGLDMDRLKTDMDDPAIQATIERNLVLAQDLRITGTPGFVVGDQILRGATDLKTLQGLIYEARTKR